MPAWGDDDQLTRDPQKEISLIYYPNREGLKGIASTALKPSAPGPAPEPRTTHIISNVELLGAARVWRCVTAGSPGAIAISTRMPILALPAAWCRQDGGPQIVRKTVCA